MSAADQFQHMYLSAYGVHRGHKMNNSRLRMTPSVILAYRLRKAFVVAEFQVRLGLTKNISVPRATRIQFLDYHSHIRES